MAMLSARAGAAAGPVGLREAYEAPRLEPHPREELGLFRPCEPAEEGRPAAL